MEIDNLNYGVSLQETLNTSVLLYADDISIFFRNGGWNEMLNKLDYWCRNWRITVNETKTKVLHFGPKAMTATNYVFKYGNQKIDIDTCSIVLDEIMCRYEIFHTIGSKSRQ